MKCFKQYVAHISNVAKEDLNESFGKEHLDVLKKEYGTLQKIDPTSDSYKKLISLLNTLPQEYLKSLANADIKFVSKLAKNRLKESIDLNDALREDVTVDVSSAAKLFQKFLRSTGAPDKGAKLQPKATSTNSTVFIGTSTNSKFDYVIDVSKRTVTATQPHTMGRPHSYVWDDKTGEVKMVEGVVVETPPQTPKSKMDK